MKQGSFRVVRLIIFLLAMVCLAGFSAFGDEHTTDYQSIVLDSFDGATNHEWSFGGRTYKYDFEWKVDASKFASKINDESYPKLTYVPAWPMAVFGTNRDQKDIKSLGVWGKFDRRGYNWIDLYPVKTGSSDNSGGSSDNSGGNSSGASGGNSNANSSGASSGNSNASSGGGSSGNSSGDANSGGSNGDEPEPFEIPIPGRIQYLDLWVWGSNLNYYMEAYFRDHQGVVYNLYLGSLSFQGWRNLRTRIPTNIPQSKRILPRLAGLTFVKFRIWTTPVERVDNFYIYFKQMKVLTDTFESLYDGDELADPERVQELWANNSDSQGGGSNAQSSNSQSNTTQSNTTQNNTTQSRN